MNTRIKDLTGKRFGRLVVKHFAYMRHSTSYWNCLCDCGKQHVVCGTSLTRGSTKSCGCFHDEKAKERATKHGYAHSKIYYVWQAMIKRCQNPKDKSYINYGGRGITVCAEWQNFMCFYKWAKTHGYKDGKSIDRVDNNMGYSPTNCRWATRKQQNNNTRKTHKITYKNTTKTLTDWCKELGLNHNTIYARIYCYKWPIEKALTTPIGGHIATL